MAVGYLTDTARFATKDEVQTEVPKLVALLRSLDDRAEDKLLALATGNSSPWVRYFASIHIATERPVEVAAILVRLKEEGGLVSAAALLALHQLQSKPPGPPPLQ